MNERNDKNSRRIIWLLAIIALGVSLFVEYLVSQNLAKWVSDFLAKLAMVFVTVAVVDALWNKLGGKKVDNTVYKLENRLENQEAMLIAHTNRLDDQVKKLDELFVSVSFLDKSRTSGLVDLFEIKTVSLPELHERFTNAKNHVYLMGYHLNSWIKVFPDFPGKVSALANRQVRVHLMIMDESNVRLPAFANENLPGSTMANAVQGIANFADAFSKINLSINATKPSLVKVKKGLISTHVCIIDSWIYFTPYFYTKSTAESPMYVASGDDSVLFHNYFEEFKALWNENKEGTDPVL